MNSNSLERTGRAILRVASGFLGNPDSVKYLFPWLRSMLPWHSPLSDEVPWVPFKARTWLEACLNPDMSVFEWGSGGSTLFLARRVGNLVSVEHDKEWHEQVCLALSDRGISNCHYILREPEELPDDGADTESNRSYASAVKRYAGMSFESYVKVIDEYPDESFDLVFVDGRARVSCISHALRKIRPGGYMVLDNSDRRIYDNAFAMLAEYQRTDLFGLIAYTTHWRQTTTWKIDPGRPGDGISKG